MREALLQATEAGTSGSAPPALGFAYLCLKGDILVASFDETRKASPEFDSRCRQLEDLRGRLAKEKLYALAVSGASVSKASAQLMGGEPEEDEDEGTDGAASPIEQRLLGLTPERAKVEADDVAAMLADLELEN